VLALVVSSWPLVKDWLVSLTKASATTTSVRAPAPQPAASSKH
jgi:hypothetical protein